MAVKKAAVPSPDATAAKKAALRKPATAGQSSGTPQPPVLDAEPGQFQDLESELESYSGPVEDFTIVAEGTGEWDTQGPTLETIKAIAAAGKPAPQKGKGRGKKPPAPHTISKIPSSAPPSVPKPSMVKDPVSRAKKADRIDVQQESSQKAVEQSVTTRQYTWRFGAC